MLNATFAVLTLAFSPLAVETDLWEALPEDCLIVLEAPALSGWLKEGLQAPWIKRVRALEPVQELLKEASIQPEGALLLADLFLGRPVLPALAEVCSEGLCVGFGVGNGRLIPYVIAESSDERRLESNLKRLARKVGESRGLAAGEAWDSATEFKGGRIWQVGSGMVLGWRGRRLFMGPGVKPVKRMMALKGAVGGTRNRQAWSKLQNVEDPEAKVRLWVDLAEIEASVEKTDLRELREIVSAPAIHFILGSEFARLGSAGSGLFELVGDKDRLELSVKTVSEDEAVDRGLRPSGPMPMHMPLAQKGEVMRGQLFRNVHGLFEHRLDLFPTRSQTKFAEAVANMSLFLGGQDPEDFLFPHLSPWIGVISREVSLDPKPDLPLPAICFITQIENQETLGPQLIAGFQTAIGLVNVDAAQEREPSMLLSLQVFDGIPVTSAHYLPPANGMGVDMRYNMVPACAVVNDVFVIGTHVDLVREVARQVKRGELARAATAMDGLSLSGAGLKRLLEANSDAMILNAVLNEGKSTEQATAEIHALLSMVGQVQSMDVSVGVPAKGVTQFTLELQMLPRRSR